jgi:hypothetical protein
LRQITALKAEFIYMEIAGKIKSSKLKVIDIPSVIENY